MPRVSVLIPLYKAEKYIAETIESVLAQSYTDYEVIIVDDCGMDGALEIAESYQKKDDRIHIFRNERNYGIAYTRNRGLDMCTGEYIALLDHDDVMVSDRLEKQVVFLDANPTIGAVGGNAQWIDGEGAIVREMIEVERDPLEVKMFLHFRNIFNNSEMTFRKAIADKNNIRYCDDCYGMEDFRFWIEFSKVSKMTNIPDMVLKKRCLSDNETSKSKQNFFKERQEKFYELQKYSLEKSGFIISDQDEFVLRKYMGEEHTQCRRYNEIIYYLSPLFDDLLEQAKELQLDCHDNMENWFHDLIEWHVQNIDKSVNLADERKLGTDIEFTIFEKYVGELQRNFNDLKKWTDELQEGKDWLEGQWNMLKQQVQELKAKNGKN